MNYRFYTVSSDAWDAMLAAIKKAKKSIYWESYIFDDDTKEHDFFGSLQSKAREGVEVKLVIDSLGSFWLSSKTVNELRAAGAEVLFFNRLIPWWNSYHFKHWWFNRNHRKLLIVDNEIAFIGGVNVGKRFKNWLDLQVELRGAILRYLIRSFVVSYKLSGGKDKIKYKSVIRKTKIRVFNHSPLTQKSVLKKYYKQACLSAKRKIVIATPYFLPQGWLIRYLHGALKRGVRIEIILPKKTDYWLATMANYTMLPLVYKPGMHFYFTNQMQHAKALLVDDREGIIGSQNIDALSFDYNLEGGIVFQRKNIVKDLRRII